MSEISDDRIELAIDALLLGVGGGGASTVGPHARKKLKGLLEYYAKKPHPFRACVRDNRKRFGPQTEAYCATLKDIIRGTTKWRGKDNKKDKGTKGLKAVEKLSEDYTIDDELAVLLEQITEESIDNANRILLGE